MYGCMYVWNMVLFIRMYVLGRMDGNISAIISLLFGVLGIWWKHFKEFDPIKYFRTSAHSKRFYLRRTRNMNEISVLI